MKAKYEEAKIKVDWLARQSGEMETQEEASERMRGTQESVVMFEQAMLCMKRLELMVLVDACCQSFGVRWE